MAEADDDLTFAELLVASTAQDALAYLITRLATRGLPVTNWRPTGLYRSLLATVSEFLADLAQTIPTIARSGFLRYARGAWLTLYAKSAYQEDRILSVFAVVRIQLTNATASPITISPGALWMTLATQDGRRWNNANAADETLPASSTLDLDFRAEFAGGSYDLSLDLPPALVLQTPITGVTLAVLEAVDGDLLGLGTAMTTAGADEESDAQLIARCEAKWASIAWAGPALSYESWAREASDSVRRVFTDDTNPDGPGTARVYLAGDLGGVGGADITAVDDVIQVRKPPTATIVVQTAGTTAVAIVAVLVCTPGLRETARLEIYDALVEHVRGLAISDGSTGKLRYHQVAEIMMAALPDEDGDIDTLTLNGGVVSIQPPLGNVITITGLTPEITWLTFVAP